MILKNNIKKFYNNSYKPLVFCALILTLFSTTSLVSTTGALNRDPAAIEHKPVLTVTSDTTGNKKAFFDVVTSETGDIQAIRYIDSDKRSESYGINKLKTVTPIVKRNNVDAVSLKLSSQFDATIGGDLYLILLKNSYLVTQEERTLPLYLKKSGGTWKLEANYHARIPFNGMHIISWSRGIESIALLKDGREVQTYSIGDDELPEIDQIENR